MSSHDQLVTGQQAKSSGEIETLQQRLHKQIAEKESILVQLEKEKEKTKARQKELRDSSKDIEEVLDSFEKEQQSLIATKNQEIELLKEENRDLAISLEQLKSELYTVKQSNSQSNESIEGSSNDSTWSTEQVTELLEALFPDTILYYWV